VWFNYRLAGRMWPPTAFSVARGSIQEKSSNQKYVEKRMRLQLPHWIACAGQKMNHIRFVYHFYFISLFYDQIRRYGPPLSLIIKSKSNPSRICEIQIISQSWKSAGFISISMFIFGNYFFLKKRFAAIPSMSIVCKNIKPVVKRKMNTIAVKDCLGHLKS